MNMLNLVSKSPLLLFGASPGERCYPGQSLWIKFSSGRLKLARHHKFIIHSIFLWSAVRGKGTNLNLRLVMKVVILHCRVGGSSVGIFDFDGHVGRMAVVRMEDLVFYQCFLWRRRARWHCGGVSNAIAGFIQRLCRTCSRLSAGPHVVSSTRWSTWLVIRLRTGVLVSKWKAIAEHLNVWRVHPFTALSNLTWQG